MSSCRTSKPPSIEICIGDGFGGADCVETDQSHVVKTPSQLQNYWMTNENDMKNFSSWCYGAKPSQVEAVTNDIHARAMQAGR